MTNSKYVAFDRLNEVYGFTVNFIFIFDEPSVKKKRRKPHWCLRHF